MNLRVLVAASLISLGVGQAQARADDPQADAIAQAIERGVAFLKAQQEPRGHWSFSFNHDHTLGITALAGLALMENGIDRADPSITRASSVVHSLAIRSTQTYDLALAILFLARAQVETRGPDDRLIQRLAARLAAGEQGGMWTYTVPLESVEDDERPRRRSSDLSRRVGEVGDNSNTQFALLGIWAASRHGFDPNASLAAIDSHFRRSPDRRGRWGYVSGAAGTDSMTCAGLMGLAISAARPNLAERQTARARGAALAADPIFANALQAVAKDARKIGQNSDIYYIWSLERVCVALGLRNLDGFDWYETGAHELLRRQMDDGGWPEPAWGRTPNTCLALLFLRKANLAFELDRVLKLPAAPRLDKQADEVPVPEKAKDEPPRTGGEENDVVVTGASDSNFPEISVEFEVKRPDGTYLLDATEKDFKVTEEGQPVVIRKFQSPVTTQAHATTVVLVVDRSRSMEEEDRIGALKRSVSSFLKGLPPGSRVAVVAFGSDVKTICPFTGDPQKVQEAVDGLTPEGATRYYDAVAEALEMLNREQGRRAVLALTDGEDTFSQSATLDSVIVAARRLGLPVHTLGLGTEDEIESDALRRLAVETRGQYYPARQADQLRSIYEQLAERLRSSYSLSYQSDRALPDGTLRPVRIYYRASRKAGETAVFIPGMVVPAGGWPQLFLVLVAGLVVLAALPGWLGRKPKHARP
ncbi:vWA domain-containing protein [Singulisphaera acidiphila]|uniref:Mg-chelatase subunit ChlD n=1 Tax=Singulisphaera acidiphila (strain ATCC BAA-1392 / DSM 18658 / VKM B-2454 / MOB10) TaxID=886293 RepID=L0DBY6_SINAD|nr:VWA domain-containing protein [Singulisphaera acidiphila]AGA26186.1 Mg-chelatase subunit ChlD [Singulisphaera acidiphila DSM 18658]